MSLYCNLLGQPCVKGGCKQYNAKIGSCRFKALLGEFLYSRLSEKHRGEILRYFGEINPDLMSAEVPSE